MGRTETTKPNGVSDTLPEGWNVWPGLNESARRLGCAHSVITKLVRDGAVQRIIDPTGTPRYSPTDLEASRGLFDEEPKGGIGHEEFRAGTELVKQVLAHHEKMVPLLVAGYEAMMKSAEARVLAVGEEIKKRDERIAELERERDENAKAREAALSDEHARLLAERSLEAAERRKDKTLDVARDKLLPLLLQKWGLGDPRMQIGSELLGTIKRDQLLGLLAIGVLDEKQAALVLKLLHPLTSEERDALRQAGVIKDPPATAEGKPA